MTSALVSVAPPRSTVYNSVSTPNSTKDKTKRRHDEPCHPINSLVWLLAVHRQPLLGLRIDFAAESTSTSSQHGTIHLLAHRQASPARLANKTVKQHHELLVLRLKTFYTTHARTHSIHHRPARISFHVAGGSQAGSRCTMSQILTPRQADELQVQHLRCHRRCCSFDTG